MSGGSMTFDPTSRGWPMKSSVSSSPISSTTPTSSWPSVNGQGSCRGQWPLRMWRSVPQTPQAAMRMSAALGGTSGFGTSRITGGSPGASKVATRTFGMDPPNGERKGASIALPLAATAMRGKIHNDHNPVNPSALVLRVSGGGDHATYRLVRYDIRWRQICRMQPARMYYSVHSLHRGYYGEGDG